MGSLTAATPLPLGVSTAQISATQSAFVNIVPSSQNLAVSGSALSWNPNGAIGYLQNTEVWSNAFYPYVLAAAGGGAADFINSPALSPAPAASATKSFLFQVSADTRLTQMAGQVQSTLCRFEIVWTGGGGRTDYVEINPITGIVRASQNITSVYVDAFTAIAFNGNATNTQAIVYEVQCTVAALPAGITAGSVNFYPSRVLATARCIFGAPMIVEGSILPDYVPSGVAGASVNSSVFGQPIHPVIAPRYPRLLLNDNYGVDCLFDSGIELVQTVAGKTITFSSAPKNVLGCDVKVVNASGGALTIQGNAVAKFKGPGFAAAGVTSFSMPSGATYPNNAITLTGDFASGSTTVHDWYITSSSVGVFNSSGVPITPTLAPGGAGTIIRSDGTNWAVSQSTYPDLIASGNVLFATAANTIGSNASFTWASNILNSPIFSAGNGTAAAPTYVFAAASNTGFYSVSSSDVGLSLAGVELNRFTSSGSINNTGGFAIGASVGGPDVCLVRNGANNLRFSASQSTTTTSRTEINKAISAIADNTATATFTVTVPNSAQSASIRVRLTGSLGAGGAIGANESTQDAEYHINITRTAGVNAVATIGAVTTQAAAASVAGAANAATTGTLSAISGAVGATNTFTINVTIARSGGASTNHTCFAFAELLNANASGVTIA